MKVGKLVSTNSKGQIVIPQQYREMLNISENMTLNIVLKYNGLFIEPVGEVIPLIEKKNVYLDVLASTKGSWSKSSSKNTKNENLELEASTRRRKKW